MTTLQHETPNFGMTSEQVNMVASAFYPLASQPMGASLG